MEFADCPQFSQVLTELIRPEKKDTFRVVNFSLKTEELRFLKYKQIFSTPDIFIFQGGLIRFSNCSPVFEQGGDK